MNILLLPSTFNCRNMGDVAMLQVCVGNLRKSWPDAVISVPTDLSEELRRHCPQVHATSARDLRIRFHEDIFLGQLAGKVPLLVKRALRIGKRYLRRRHPEVLNAIAAIRFRDGSATDVEFTPFQQVLRSADLIVVSGAGGLNDACREWAQTTLEILEDALDQGVPAAMFGQGIGPLRDASILEKFRTVAPRLALLTLREGLFGPRLLETLGHPVSDAAVTGDDAVLLAYGERPADLGDRLGMNVRISASSGVGEQFLDQLGPVIRELTLRKFVTLLPIPIAHDHDHSDSRSLESLESRCGGTLEGGRELDSPLKVIRQVARCRVVVTGAYHAAVFALAQGIPAVGLAGSEYFMAKFQGLARQFPSGCDVVPITGNDFGPKLLDAIERAWQKAPFERERLLERARDQAERCRRAYEALGDALALRESRS